MLYVCYVTTPHVVFQCVRSDSRVVSRWNIKVSLWFIGLQILQVPLIIRASLASFNLRAGTRSRRIALLFVARARISEAISVKSGTSSRLVIEKSIAMVEFIDW